MIDLQYHNVRTDQGLYYKLERENLVHRMCKDKNIERAMHAFPPETTRAKFVGRLCNSAMRRKLPVV